MRTVCSALLVLVLVATPWHATAAQERGTIELGALGHFSNLDRDVGLGDTSFGVGGRVGFFPVRWLALEGEYSPGTLEDMGRNAGSWHPFRALAVLNLPVTRHVTLLAGAGYKGEIWKDDATYNEFEGGATVLGGLRVCFGRGWSIRPEVIVDHNPYPNFQSVGGNSNYLGFRIGVSRFFRRGLETCSGASFAPAPTQAAAPAPAAAPPPQPAAPPRPVAASPAPAQPPREMFRLDGVLFDFDRATLRPEGRALLDSAMSLLNAEAGIRVEIQGHTDPIGTDAYNEGLSLRRANAVRDHLISLGIAASRMTTRAFGESQPVADNDTAAGRQQNRRVVVIEITN